MMPDTRDPFVLLQGYSRKYNTRIRVIEHPGVLPYKDHFQVFLDTDAIYCGGTEMPIKQAGRLRDGGTTTIELEDGRIVHRPAPRFMKPSYFDGEELVCGCPDCEKHYRLTGAGLPCDCSTCEGRPGAHLG